MDTYYFYQNNCVFTTSTRATVCYEVVIVITSARVKWLSYMLSMSSKIALLVFPLIYDVLIFYKQQQDHHYWLEFLQVITSIISLARDMILK